jgi:DNA-binding CsgD family transcriptional regulator
MTAANALFEALAPRVDFGAFGRLRLADRSAGQLLAAAIAGAASDGTRSVRSIPVPAREDGPALVLHVSPLRRAAHDIFVRSSVLLVVTPVEAPDAPLTEVLTGLFDLTPAEARVAGSVARGQSVDEIATTYSLSRETVRTQLKAVMAKTGTERQTALALLLAGARPLGR